MEESRVKNPLKPRPGVYVCPRCGEEGGNLEFDCLGRIPRYTLDTVAVYRHRTCKHLFAPRTLHDVEVNPLFKDGVYTCPCCDHRGGEADFRVMDRPEDSYETTEPVRQCLSCNHIFALRRVTNGRFTGE